VYVHMHELRGERRVRRYAIQIRTYVHLHICSTVRLYAYTIASTYVDKCSITMVPVMLYMYVCNIHMYVHVRYVLFMHIVLSNCKCFIYVHVLLRLCNLCLNLCFFYAGGFKIL